MSAWQKTTNPSTHVESASYDAIWGALFANSLTELEAALEKDPSAINMMGTGYFEGETPLIFSANTGRTSFARLLLRYGAELTWRNKQGKTAMDIAKEKDFDDISTELAHYQKKIDELGPSVKARQWTVEIISATGIKAADRGKTSDPYVVVNWDTQTKEKHKHKTQVIKKTLVPAWKEKFVMELPEAETKELLMDVFDWNHIGSHEFLGRAVLPLDALAKFYPGPLEYTQPLAPRSAKDKKVSGSIRFCVHTSFKEKLQPNLHFSRSLADSLAQAKKDGQVHVIDRCIEFLDKDVALRTEGIIRIPGSKGDIYRLKDKIDEGKNVSFDIEDPMDVAGLLKLYMYCLPDSLFPRSAYIPASKINFEANMQEAVKELRKLVVELGEPHFSILKKVVKYFVKLTGYAVINKMDPRAISISIGPSILVHPDIREDQLQFIEATKIVPPLMQAMVTYFDAIFNNGDIVPTVPPAPSIPSTPPPPPTDSIPLPPERSAPPPPSYIAPPPSDKVAPPPTDKIAPPPTDSIAPPPTDKIAPPPADYVPLPVITPPTDTPATTPTLLPATSAPREPPRPSTPSPNPSPRPANSSPRPSNPSPRAPSSPRPANSSPRPSSENPAPATSTAPEPTITTPATTEPAPQTTETAPQTTETAPQTTEPAPQPTETTAAATPTDPAPAAVPEPTATATEPCAPPAETPPPTAETTAPPTEPATTPSETAVTAPPAETATNTSETPAPITEQTSS